MFEDLDVAALRCWLSEGGYTIDEVIERITDVGQSGLLRNSTIPASMVLEGAHDPQATMIRLWLLQQSVSHREAEAAFDTDTMVTAGILEERNGLLRAVVDVRPYGSSDDGATGWVVSDPMPGLDQVVTRTRADYVLGVSPASSTLAEITIRRQVGAALDLGTGCGVQSLHLARHSDRVVATDVNPRAVATARLTAQLNDVSLDLREGSLYQPVAGERFDLIVTNPPYVISPPRSDDQRLVYREGQFAADGLVRHVIRHAPGHLTEGGTLQVLGNWAITADQPWQERLAGWVDGLGCDLWVLEREQLDVYEYIEMWLTDAGFQGSGHWKPRYREWLDYFDQLGITGVGMGWVSLTNAGREDPDVECEVWPHAVQQSLGVAFADRPDAVTNSLRELGDILAARWRVSDSVQQETNGDPGASDPRHIVLRSSTGLRRATQVSSTAAAVLGACDGELRLSQIVNAVAGLLDQSAAEVLAEVHQVIRDALRTGMLEPSGDLIDG